MIGMVKGFVCAFGVVLMAGMTLWGRETVRQGARKGGLASGYPGDEGIEKDARVIFVDDFETGTVAETGARWGQIIQGRRTFHFGGRGGELARGEVDVNQVSGAPVHAHEGRGHDVCAVLREVSREDGVSGTPGDSGADSTRSRGRRGCGDKAGGGQVFLANIEPAGRNEGQGFKPPGIWQFYCYWHEMKPDGRGNYWGNVFFGKKEQIETGAVVLRGGDAEGEFRAGQIGRRTGVLGGRRAQGEVRGVQLADDKQPEDQHVLAGVLQRAVHER